MSDARHVVTVRVAHEFKRFPDIGLKPFDVSMLEPRDASLAKAIDRAVNRRWFSLIKLIDHSSSRKIHKLDAPVAATLLVATAQMMLLDRIPDHAVINSAVDWIKNNGHPRASGFVNAVLRKITKLRGAKVECADVAKANHFLKSDGSAWELTENVFVNDIASQVGFSKKCWVRLINEFGDSVGQEIAFGSVAEAPVIVTTNKKNECPYINDHSIENFGIVQHGVELTQLLEEYPKMRVQDPTSAGSLNLLKDINPQRILDLCAGRGTKTRQLRELFPNAMIGATEPNDTRRTILQDIAPSINAAVFSQDGDSPNEPFDLVVVDAPCSNSGVFSRRLEAKYRFDSKHIHSLVELQREIIMDASRVLLNNGYLLYTTCSIDNAENRSQANWIVEYLPFTQIDEKTTMPSGYPGSNPADWHDGGYAVLFQKK